MTATPNIDADPDEFYEEEDDGTTAAESTDSTTWFCENPEKHFINAGKFLCGFAHEEFRTLIFVPSQNTYYRWNGTKWVSVTGFSLDALLRKTFSLALYHSDDGPQPFPLENKFVNNLMNNVRAQTIVNDDTEINSWLAGDGPDPKNVIVVKNGLLDVETNELLPHTPRFFNAHTTTFDYDPSAPEPKVWTSFVKEVFEGDIDRMNLLQEWFGYCLTLDTSLQKTLDMIGPPGAGKGTTLFVMEHLIGAPNVGSASMASLGEPHGLEDIVNKPLVMLSDVQNVGRHGASALEILANITGEDRVKINPKNKPAYSTHVPCRIVMASNSVPKLPDRDGALQRRLLMLMFRKTFTDNPDQTLRKKLSEELPGIMNWALEGLSRLRKRGDFVQPEIGTEELEILAEGAAPEIKFASECCHVAGADDQDLRIAKDDLYEAWATWRDRHGYEKRYSDWTSFFKVLKGRFPYLDGRQKTSSEDGRRPAVRGITLTDEALGKYVIPTWRG